MSQSQASTATASDLVQDQPTVVWKVLLPYLISIAAQLPLLIYYFSDLWARPHYQFFPFALIMVAVFAAMRWPRNLPQPFIARKTSVVLFWAGIVFGIAGSLFATQWFSATSLVLLATSLFSMTRDGEVSGKTLMVLGLPLLIILMPPAYLDFRLITFLQQLSAQISSWYLDILDFKHFSPGTTLNFPNNQYEVEQACSGVQSFFTLLFCTSFLIISLRRPWFRSFLLLISAGFWALFMNSVRILMIPIADIVFDLDLVAGLKHDLLGYTAMVFAIVMILSTDQLLEFLFGRSGQDVDDERKANWFQRVILQRTDTESGTESGGKTIRPVSTGFIRAAMIGTAVMVLFGGQQLLDVVRAINQPRTTIRVFTSDVIVDLDKNALPDTLESSVDEATYSWKNLGYERHDRTRGSDFGKRSDTWKFFSEKSGIRADASIDQTFPGWHELTTCYKNQGWKIKRGARKKSVVEFTNEDGETVLWPFIEVEMEQPSTAQRGFLLFSFTDAAGKPFDAPVEWGKLLSLFEKAKNRLSHNVRSTLFRGEAYQMQVFTRHAIAFTESQKSEIRNQYLQLRIQMRSALLKYSDEDYLPESDTP